MAYIREYPLGILPGTTCILIFVERRWYIKNVEFSIAVQTCAKLQRLTLFQRTLSLCVRGSKWGSVHTKRGELAVRLNKQTRFQYIILLIIHLIPMYLTFYYVAILFSVPSHQKFNSLYRVKFKRRIRNNEARRTQTACYFILVIFRTDLLSQGKIPFIFKSYLHTNIAQSRGQKSDASAVRTDLVPLRPLGWFLSTYTA